MTNSGQFQPGQSGNPNGRPKKGQSLAEKFRDAMAEAKNEQNPDYAKLDAVIDKLVEKALAGDQSAIEYCLARGWGKMIDRVENNNVNKNYDFSNLPMDERLKLLELLSNAGATVPSDNPDTL